MTRMLTVLLLLLPISARAALQEITLFPETAQVQEITTVTLQQAGAGMSSCEFTLSGQADPQSLRLGILPEGLALVDTTWTSSETVDLAALEPLNLRLAELTQANARIVAELAGVQGRIDFWRAQGGVAAQNMTALRELASELGGALRMETEAAQELQRKKQDSDDQITRLKQKIELVTGSARQVWVVRLLFSGSTDKPVKLTYAYTLEECGWLPVYRLDAKPDGKKIEFSWQAKVWQHSGQDWNGVKLHLATLQPQQEAAPPELPAWQITPQQPVMFKAMAAAPAPVPQAELADAAPSAPVEVQKGTYAQWDMGERSLPAGDIRVLEIERQSWPASFEYLIRPSVSPKAFLQGHAIFEKPKDLPTGTAFFLMDGAVVDEREMTLAGREANLFFGSTPMLVCTTTLKDKKTGEAGIIAQKQTFSRQWTLTVKNTGARPAVVRVEEPKPLSRDERITLSFSVEPKPLADKNPEILAWNSTIGAGAEISISMSLNFEAPEELRINPGWRW